jgi:microcystin-dependent protein
LKNCQEPSGWTLCNGQRLHITQNSALYAVIGLQYGGDGKTTFALPDLRGAVVGAQDAGPGLTNIPMGSKLGANQATVVGVGTVNIALTAANLPAHTHPATMAMSSLPATTTVTVGTVTVGANTGGGTAPAAPVSTTAVTSIMQPHWGLNSIICLEGLFPTRN